jgi:hypothetical protein
MTRRELLPSVQVTSQIWLQGENARRTTSTHGEFISSAPAATAFGTFRDSTSDEGTMHEQ